MPIIGLQLTQAEAGRIRLGVKVPTGNGNRTRPEKLDRFRFTSARKNLIERIAELYGGTVQPWQPPRGASQWEVITNAKEIPVVVPQQDVAATQWYEMWSAGGCQRRCDGRTETLSKQACMCDPDPSQRECNMYTRIRVMLEDVPGMGVWRATTGGFYAGSELPGAAAFLANVQGAVPGRLYLDPRTVVRDGKTKNFVVPVLDCADLTPKELMSGRVQELITARNRAAVAGEVRTAIAASVDYPSLIAAARTVEALFDLHRQAKDANGGEVPADLLALFEQRANAIRAGQPVEPQAAPVVSGEVVDAPGADDPDTVWQQVMEATVFDSAEELEADFIRVVGRSSADASAADMREYLKALAGRVVAA